MQAGANLGLKDFGASASCAAKAKESDLPLKAI